VEGSCKHGNEPSGSIKCWEVLEYFTELRSSALRPTPNLEDQVPAFKSPSGRVVQLCPQASGSLFVAFYNSVGL
jgi:hypothetical protein